jgi:hypothetical protein
VFVRNVLVVLIEGPKRSIFLAIAILPPRIHNIAKIGLSLADFLIPRREIFCKILYKSAKLYEILCNFSLPGVWARRVRVR